MGRGISVALAIAAFAVQPSMQQKDPLRDFCRRFSHQTALIDNKLFIDGGLINYNPLNQNPLNYTNTGLLYADMRIDNQGMPQNYANLSKPAQAPSVSGGVLWPDTVNKKFFLYGGEFYQQSPQNFAVWSYDAIYNNWTTVAADNSQQFIQRTSYGGSVVEQSRGIGYWYGGWLSNTTIPVWSGPGLALNSLLQYDMVNNVWTNSSGPDNIGRAEGQMVYIPASDGGMLVYFGGIQMASGASNWTGQALDTIYLYDISNSKWYIQKATGQIPDMRRRFCGGAAWAPDQSSYNIYIYGGLSMPPNTIGFDDIYILSIPSFTWTKWFSADPSQAYPHHSLTCNVVNGGQMIVMGGSFPNSSICDAPSVYGFHNIDMSQNNPDNAKWSKFNNTKRGYSVPGDVVKVVGGGGNGGATKTTPDNGFANSDLAVYFTRKASVVSSRTPTRAIPTSTDTSDNDSSSSGAIIGGAVGGGLALLLLIAALVFFCLRRRRRSAPAAPAQHDPMEQRSPDQYNSTSYQHLHTHEAPVQLPNNEFSPPVELASNETRAFDGTHDKNMAYTTYSGAGSHSASPSHSPATLHAGPGGYFPPTKVVPPSYASHGYLPQADHGHSDHSPTSPYSNSPHPFHNYSPHSISASPSTNFVASPINPPPVEFPAHDVKR